MTLDRATVPSRRRALSAWTITVAATAASAYALDAVATVAGVLLVGSQLLGGLDHPAALALLAATYVLWGVTLRVNLAANWLLLRRTGTSTNVVSNAAFELTRRRGPRTQRVAAAAGYVATELAKEALTTPARSAPRSSPTLFRPPTCWSSSRARISAPPLTSTCSLA